jgi:micrococcal nuclease
MSGITRGVASVAVAVTLVACVDDDAGETGDASTTTPLPSRVETTVVDTQVEEPAPGTSATIEGGSAWVVVDVVDGDTIDVEHADGRVERVRVIGIDAPESGECGYGEASEEMASMVRDREVTLTPGARDDRDRYDRLLRYVDVDGIDAGLTLIEEGLAVARYDSRDGYGAHPREDTYVATDAATPTITCPVSGGGLGSGPGGVWRNCSEARAAGAAPVYRGDPGFGPHPDRDGDGIGCE